MKSQITYEFIKSASKVRYNQGDILKDISIVNAVDFDVEKKEYKISEVPLAYGIVINQECDLEHDFNSRNAVSSPNQDKFLPNILILPAYLADSFKVGTHRADGIIAGKWTGDQFKLIRQNNNSRFHFIESNEEYQIPQLVIDFKHIFTISRNIIYKNISQIYLASIGEIYRESLSHRYSHFLSRIGLPEINS